MALWYGGKLVVDEGYSGGNVLTVFFSVIMGGFALGQFGSSSEGIAKGQGAGFKVFQVIERPSAIDPSVEVGEKPELKGNIELKV